MGQLLNVSEVVATHARLHPDKIGARDSRRALTFRDWHERASQLANGLLGLGLQQGDRVAVLAYNCVEWMEIYVGLARAGLVAVPINFRLVGAEIAYIVGHCEARAIIVQDALLDRVMPIRDMLGIPPQACIYLGHGGQRGEDRQEGEAGQVVQARQTGQVSQQRCDARGDYVDQPVGGRAPGDWTAYEALIEGSATTDPGILVRPEDTWALMYTSGTTGRPKGAIRSHSGSASISLITALDMGLTAEDTALLVMPMCHANSLYFSFTFTYLGATCVIDDRKSFDPEGLLRTLAEQRITFTSLVPTHYIMLQTLPAATRERYDVSRVSKLMISSAPARRGTKLAIMEQFPNSQLFELYGSTEAGWVTILRPHEQLTKLGSVGREWTGSGAVKLLDIHGREVPDGEVGELFSCTPYAFDGYWKDPGRTADAFRGAWCSVGDLARRDEDGFYHLVDRKNNMIISGGENIYPSEVEGVLGGHPAVQDVAVIGVPHEKWGEAVHAVIVPQAGSTASEEEILAWCRERIAGYKRPRSISFIDDAEMPRTATGKIQHRILRDRFTTQT